MSVGYIPSIERLRMPARPPQSWGVAPWSAAMVGDPAIASRRAHRGLILDLDETLYPRERFVSSGFAAVARQVASAHGIDVTRAYGVLTRAHAGPENGRELQALCHRLALSQDLVPAMLDVFRRHVPAIWLNHAVAETLQALRASGWRLAILTNGLPSVQFRKIAALGLSLLVDEVTYAEEHVAGGKPAAGAFRAVLRSLELAPEQCICVGDDLVNDIHGARAVGIRTIRVARGARTLAPGDEADMVIDHVAQLPEAAGLVLGMVSENVA